MNYFSFGGCDSGLAQAISKLSDVLAAGQSITQQDLINLELRLNMKLSEIKSLVTNAAAKNVEAFAELGALVALLNQQLADAIANATDPEVTDEAFLASLAELDLTATKLADIVPNPEPPVEPEVPVVEPPAEPTGEIVPAE